MSGPHGNGSPGAREKVHIYNPWQPLQRSTRGNGWKSSPEDICMQGWWRGSRKLWLLHTIQRGTEVSEEEARRRAPLCFACLTIKILKFHPPTSSAMAAMPHSIGSSSLAARVRRSYAACHVTAVPFVQDEGALLREWKKRRRRKEECSSGDAHHAGCFWQTRICRVDTWGRRNPPAPPKNCCRKFCTTAWRLIIPH